MTGQNPQKNVPLSDDDVKRRLRANVVGFQKLSDECRTTNLVNAQAEMRFAIDRILGDPTGKLRECAPDTIARAFMMCANVGLSLNPILQYATFIPTWNKDLSMFECQLWPMYRGLMKLATDSGMVKAVKAENVYSADEFKMWDESGSTGYRHIINITEKRNTPQNHYLGTYVVAHLGNPPPEYLMEWVPAEDIYKMRDASKNYDKDKPNCVWIKWREEQQRKSAIKRARKYWPQSNGDAFRRFEEAVNMDNVIEGVSFDREKPPKEIAFTREPEVKKITLAQAEQLVALAKEKKIDPMRISKAYFVSDMTQIDADKFEEVKERINSAASK